MNAELMFEKGDSSPANLWLAEKHIAGLRDALNWSASPASKLYTEMGANGKMKYGRHSALEKMEELGRADLARVNLTSLTDLERILDALDAA